MRLESHGGQISSPPLPFHPKNGHYQKSCEGTGLVEQLCSPSLSGDDQLGAANCGRNRTSAQRFARLPKITSGLARLLPPSRKVNHFKGNRWSGPTEDPPSASALREMTARLPRREDSRLDDGMQWERTKMRCSVRKTSGKGTWNPIERFDPGNR